VEYNPTRLHPSAPVFARLPRLRPSSRLPVFLSAIFPIRMSWVHLRCAPTMEGANMECPHHCQVMLGGLSKPFVSPVEATHRCKERKATYPRPFECPGVPYGRARCPRRRNPRGYALWSVLCWARRRPPTLCSWL
jgi:hypothetical protein